MVADQGGDGGAPMPCQETPAPPCKDKVPGCMTELGCLFVVGIPVLPPRAAAGPAWSPVAYWQSTLSSRASRPNPTSAPPSASSERPPARLGAAAARPHPLSRRPGIPRPQGFAAGRAIVRAGEDPDRRQQILLSVAGQPRRKVALDDVIDLRTPGIEKLRLRPDDVNNGEANVPLTRDFALLPTDEAYLDRIGLRWETVAEGACRWLLIHRYPLPSGYTATVTLYRLSGPAIAGVFRQDR